MTIPPIHFQVPQRQPSPIEQALSRAFGELAALPFEKAAERRAAKQQRELMQEQHGLAMSRIDKEHELGLRRLDYSTELDNKSNFLGMESLTPGQREAFKRLRIDPEQFAVDVPGVGRGISRTVLEKVGQEAALVTEPELDVFNIARKLIGLKGLEEGTEVTTGAFERATGVVSPLASLIASNRQSDAAERVAAIQFMQQLDKPPVDYGLGKLVRGEDGKLRPITSSERYLLYNAGQLQTFSQLPFPDANVTGVARNMARRALELERQTEDAVLSVPAIREQAENVRTGRGTYTALLEDYAALAKRNGLAIDPANGRVAPDMARARLLVQGNQPLVEAITALRNGVTAENIEAVERASGVPFSAEMKGYLKLLLRGFGLAENIPGAVLPPFVNINEIAPGSFTTPAAPELEGAEEAAEHGGGALGGQRRDALDARLPPEIVRADIEQKAIERGEPLPARTPAAPLAPGEVRTAAPQFAGTEDETALFNESFQIFANDPAAYDRYSLVLDSAQVDLQAATRFLERLNPDVASQLRTLAQTDSTSARRSAQLIIGRIRSILRDAHAAAAAQRP